MIGTGKKTLFVLSALRQGGSATSLLNLLELLSREEGDYSLFLLEHDGIFLERAKSFVHLLPEERIVSSVLCEKRKLRQKGLFSYGIRCIFVLCHKIMGGYRARQLFFRCSAKKLKGYDHVVAFQEDLTTEYSQFIPAGSRIAWCHMDYEAFSVGRTRAEQQELYNHFKEIVCVSKYACESMKEHLLIDERHLHLIYNTIPADSIVSRSRLYSVEKGDQRFTFVSAGRFVARKCFERVVAAANELKKRGVSFKWFIIGNGEEFDNIRQSVCDNHLEHFIYLTGTLENPFPYIAVADCFILSSQTEAQPMVLNEALTLHVPVISTDFSSSREVVQDGVTGLIVENSSEGVIRGVLSFIDDETLRNRLKQGAKEFIYDNGAILRQVKDVLR